MILKSEDDAVQALGRHKANIGERYVEVFRSTGAELHQVYICLLVSFEERAVEKHWHKHYLFNYIVSHSGERLLKVGEVGYPERETESGVKPLIVTSKSCSFFKLKPHPAPPCQN